MFKGAFRKSWKICWATSMFMLLAWHSINGWDQRPDRIPCYHYHPLSRFTPTLSSTYLSSSFSLGYFTLWQHDGLTHILTMEILLTQNEKWWCISNFKLCHFFRFEPLFCCNIQCTHCLKITQNVAFQLLNFGIFHQFLYY